MEKKRDFLDFLETILKYKKLLLYTFIVAAVLSLIVSLLLPLWYRSSAKVFFPEQSGGLNVDMSAVLGNVPIDLGTPGVIGNERLNSIFSSRVFLDDVIAKFHLQEVYEQEYLFKTREMLSDNISTDMNYALEHSVGRQVYFAMHASAQSVFEHEGRVIDSVIVAQFDSAAHNRNLAAQLSERIQPLVINMHCHVLRGVLHVVAGERKFRKDDSFHAVPDRPFNGVNMSLQILFKIGERAVRLDDSEPGFEHGFGS